MNKIFKTKYDVTTGQTKAVSELANNRQVASSSGEKPKCGGFLGYALGLFKLAPLALLVCGLLPSVGQAADVWLLSKEDLKKNGNGDLHEGTGIMYDQGGWGYNHGINQDEIKNQETTLLTSGRNRTGAETQLRNRDFWRTVAIGSRAVAGGNDTTAVGYKAIVGINSKEIKNGEKDSHQGTAVGYRAFSYGQESVSLGNDTVAYGASSISIGSDNVGQSKGNAGTINNPYSQKALSYDIWDLFHTHGSKFNYTGEYAATKNYSKTGDKKALYQQYLNMSGSEPAYKTHNWAYGDSSIAIGSRNVAFGHSSLAMGTSSIAKGNYSTALGTGTLAFGNSAVAVGNEVFVYNDAGVAVGNNIQSLSKGSIVYGYNSYAGGEGSVAIGTRAMSNVDIHGEHNNVLHTGLENINLNQLYDGDIKDDKDKTFKKLAKLDETRENIYKPKVEKQQGTGEDKAIKNSKTGALAIGYFVIATGENSIALGRQAYSYGDTSVAIGPYAYSKGKNSFALGYGAKAISGDSFAIGSYSRTDGKNSIALGIGSKVLNDDTNSSLNGENSLALGNETEVKMKNSVALGYKSTTNYFYKDDNKSAATLMGKDAIELPSYFPKGSSYKVDVSDADGVVSVGGWNKSGNVGLRRIVNAAPGALDSDVATVGQLKALYYVKKEGPMVYYTEEGGKQIKLVKDADGKFYKVNTDNGEPMKNSNEIPRENVLIGAKGANEHIDQATKLANIGEKIKFGHLKDAKITNDSDEAVTGAQLKNVGDILGISIKSNTNNTKFDNPSFAAINYEGSNKQGKTKFKDAVDELIQAVNKGYKFSDGSNSNSTPFYLGSTITIKADNISNTYKSTNLKVQLDKAGSTATFKIGMTETPTFKNVTINEEPTSDKHVVNKKYVDDKLKDAGKSHYLSVKEPAAKAVNYDNDGAKGANSIAIGVGAETKNGADSAVVVGHNLSTDVKHAVVVGSNINIDQQNPSDKNKKDAVVAIGSGLKLKNAKSSIVLAAVDERGDTNNTEEGRTVVDGASWAVVIGNKTKVKNGSDIVALGNNIDVSDSNNNSLVILGNQAKASNSMNSVVLGKEAETKSQNTLVLGYNSKAETAATGGVALGQQATVRKSNGIALGSNSVANTDANIVGLNTVTGANHKNASAYGAWKSRYGALSIGNGNDTRQITGLAAGKQDTDAVNVAQLKEATTHFVSINGGNNSDGNYANNGATKKGAVAIGIGTQAESDGAVSIGYGTQVLSGSNNSIAIGAVNENGSKTKIENAAWAVAIGNKTSITAGNDIVAIGNNMTVNKASGNNEVNSSLVIIGNATKATNAKSSVVIGHGATAKNVNEVVVIGKDANVEANAIGAVSIGEGASVATAAGDSIALGKGSQATTKETAQENATVEGVKFNFEAGKGVDKTVLSIGKAGTERIIKHVAAGKVSSDSTDAINGSQLFGVTKEFSKLALEVLGAEKADNGNAGFKKSTFTKVNYQGQKGGRQDTFRGAINDTITAINKGLLISDGGTTGSGTLQLGDTLQIKAGNVDSGAFSSNNIKTAYLPTKKELLIGIKKDPSFEKVTVTEEVNDKSPDETLTTKKYVDGKLENVAAKFTVKGDTNGAGGKDYTLDKNNNELNIKGAESPTGHRNISTTVDANSKAVTIELNKNLKAISTISGLENVINDQNGMLNKILTNANTDQEYTKIKDRAVNVGDLTKVATAIIDKGLEFEGNSGGKVKRTLGQTLKIVGKGSTVNGATTTENNIVVSKNSSNDGLEISLSKDLNGIDTLKKDNKKIDLSNADGIKISSEGTDITIKSDGLELNNKKITGVANGTDDNDAINKSQLNSVVTALGGGATIGADGKITGPTYTLTNGGAKTTVEEALTALDNAITKNNADADKLGEAAITFSDGKTEFTRKNSETDKKVEFKGGTNVTVTLDATTNTKKGEFTVSLNENLTGIKSIANDNTKISLKDKKITLSPEDGATLTLEKSGTDKVKISGLGDGQIADNSNDAITGKQLDDLAGKLGVAVNTEKTGFDAPSFTEIKGSNNPSKKQNTFKGAIEDLITAVNKGISFKGNDTTNGTATMQLGGTLTIDSSTVGNGTKDITASLTSHGDAKDAGTLTLTLNKAKTVSDKDEKVITSKAVAEKLKEYTTSKDLGEQFLKVDGSNINGKQADFGKNVGIDKIDLNSDKESTKLVQAKALVNYLKGTGEKSVKVSDSPTTEALGEGSVSVGHGAISKNEGSIAMGYGANALNTGAVSIGQDSNVLGMSSIGIGRENTVRGNFSFAVGDNNVIEKEQNYVMGSDNKITGKQNISIGSRNEVEGNENIILGSNITADDEIHNAIVLGTGSLAKSNALSVGSMRHKRKIVFVADPTDNYDAANKKYVDERGLKFKGNEENQTELVNLDKLLTIDSSEAQKDKDGLKEKDIKTKVEKDGDGAKLTLTLNKADEVSEHDERAVSSKAVHSALQAAKAEADKTAVKYDDPTKSSITLGGKSAKNYRPVAIDNLKSGLGIDDIKDVGITSAAQGKQGELVKDLVAGKLDTTKDARGKEIDNLHKAVNLADLKAVAQAGLNFAGNDEQDIHKNLGEKLDIVGQGLTKEKAADFKGTNGNIAVKADSTKTKLEVSLSEDLKGLKSAEFKNDKGTVNIQGDEIALKDKDGKAIIATLNDKGLTINGKYGKSAVSLTTKNDNGKDAATLEFAKEGEQGTGAITGLKDLEDNADGSSATNKNYVDNQLKKAKEDADKTAVKYDDETRDVITLGGKGTSHKPVVIDNLRSGLGIDDINDGGIASIKQGKTRDLVKDLVAGKLDEKAHKAANVSDLKALATAGLNFAGNDAKDIHKNLGETLAIVGQGVTDIALFKGTNNNIAVKTVAGNLEVSLNEALTAIKSLVTQAKSVDDKSGLSAISTLDGAGLHLTPAESLTNGQGKQADYGLLGSTVKDGEKTNTQTAGSITLAQGDKSNTSTAEKEVLTAKDDQGNTVENTQTAKGNDLVKKSNNGKLASNKQTAEDITLSKDNGNTNVSTATETKLTSKDGETASLTAKGLTVGDSTKGGDKTHAVYGKTGFSVKGNKDGSSEIVSLKVADGKDGKNTATLAFAKGADGKSGGTIKGLADIKPDEIDGSLAANKNYVDEKMSEVDSNRPFDFYIKEGKDYTKVIKGRDGQFYAPEDLEGAKYVAGTADGDKGKYTKNGRDVKSSIADKQAAVVIKAEPTTSPMTITNIKDGDLTNTSTDAINGGQLVKATGAKLIDDPSSTATPKAKIMVFADGRDGKSGVEAEAMATKGLTGKDGLNGKNANDKANALRNGEAGTVVFTDKDGNRLVKANDGKYYKATDVDDKGNVKSAANGQVAPKAVDNPQLSLVNTGGETDKPVVLGNVASGLDIDADKAKEHAENVKKAGEAVKTEAQAVAKKVDDMLTLQTAKEAKQDAIDALETALSFMPETTPEEKAAKEKAKAKIEGEKSTLADINSKLDKAKKEVESAQGILKTKQEAYQTALKAKDGAVNKLLSGDASVDVHRGANLQDLQALGQAGLNFEGNDGVPVHKNLGEKLTIKGEGEFNSATTAAGNIKVEASATGLEVKLSDKLKNMTSFETREVDGKKSRLDSNGLRVVDKDSESVVTAQGTRIAGKGNHAGKSASYTLDGVAIAGNNGNVQLNTTALSFAVTQDQAGKPVGTGVIRGLKDLDAHATGDMAANKNYVDTKHHELRTQLSHTNREMRAGIAGALAAATLPNSVIPGKSMLAASAGSFKGHSAIALGYSKMSDNGKISIRLQGTSNSAGDLGGAVGVGYLW